MEPIRKKKSHGGARTNAGRKKGAESYDTKIRREATREAVNAAKAEGITPLEYMLKVMRDETADDKRRDTMAAAAASYMHPRLSNATVNINQKRTVEEVSTDDLISALQQSGDSDRAAAEKARNGRLDRVH